MWNVFYILVIFFLNPWMMGECKALFVFWKKNKKNMLFVKICFCFYFKAEFICCKIDLKFHLAGEEVLS